MKPTQPLTVVVTVRESDDATRTHALVKLLADLVVSRRNKRPAPTPGR